MSDETAPVAPAQRETDRTMVVLLVAFVVVVALAITGLVVLRHGGDQGPSGIYAQDPSEEHVYLGSREADVGHEVRLSGLTVAAGWSVAALAPAPAGPERHVLRGVRVEAHGDPVEVGTLSFQLFDRHDEFAGVGECRGGDRAASRPSLVCQPFQLDGEPVWAVVAAQTP